MVGRSLVFGLCSGLHLDLALASGFRLRCSVHIGFASLAMVFKPPCDIARTITCRICFQIELQLKLKPKPKRTHTQYNTM